MLRWCLLFFVLNAVAIKCDQSDLEKQLQLLSKQVTALLDKREEDLRDIEDNMKKKLFERLEFGDIQDEMRKLRLDIEFLKSSTDNLLEENPNQPREKNDKMLVKWLTDAVKELKTEVVEVQGAINATVILQNHEELDTNLSLLKTDVANLNKDLEVSKTNNAKLEADVVSLKEELASLKDNFRATSVSCGRTKNQLKALQLEWMEHLKIITEKPPLTQDDPHPRHNRLIKDHIIQLEKNSKIINNENFMLKKRLIKLEREVRYMKRAETNKEISNEISSTDPILLGMQTLLNNVSSKVEMNQNAIKNFDKQLTDFDKLHISMLELLENVESVEAKVDKNFPDFRKEISKLEVQIAQGMSTISLLKEDFKNTRTTVKAISASVSNLQDGVKGDHLTVKDISNQVQGLKKLANQQSSKLHGHILKTEEFGLDLNSTKSTIHLVDELESFENGYKNMINKLPHDCSSVLGPKGVYLISPGDDKPVLAQCDKGWTTIQKRYDGTLNFYRNWSSYGQGFGNVDGEHWLGNKNIHHLTKNNCTSLQISMEDIYGNHWQAEYEDFRVGNESNGFKLFVGNYSGNASNAMDYQNNMEFSTVDNDRDISNTHCALNYEGGWWFSHCQHANLNGRYNLGLTWFDSSRNEWIAVSKTEMKVKVRRNCL